jgi:hypothetical protein
MESKIKAGDLVVTVNDDCVSLLRGRASKIEHTHIHANSANDLRASSEASVRRVYGYGISCGVAEDTVGVTDSYGSGIDRALNLIGTAVAQLLTGGESAYT